MRKLIYAITIAGITLMAACKSAPDDAELQKKAAAAITVPGVVAEVKEGSLTLSGMVTDEASKNAVETAAKSIEGIKGVTNNITIAPPASPVAITDTAAAMKTSVDAAIEAGLKSALKDFPGVTATVKDGTISVAGEISAAKWRTLKMSLDALHPKKVDPAGLKVTN